MAQDTAVWRRNAVLATSAWREALRVSAPRIGPEHLFLGLLSSGGPAARVAAHRGLTLAAARRGAAVNVGRQLRAVGRDVAREGVVPRAPVAALDRGAAGSLALSATAEALAPARRGEATEVAWALSLLDSPDGAVRGLTEAAEADVQELRHALVAALQSPDDALPRAQAPLQPAPCPLPHDVLTPPDGIHTSGAAAFAPAHMTALSVEWFLPVPLETLLELLRNPTPVAIVTAQPQDALVDDSFGAVTAVAEKTVRGGATRRTTQQLFPSEPALSAGAPDGSRRIRWSEIRDLHHLGLELPTDAEPRDDRDFTGAMDGLFEFTLIPDDAEEQHLPVDYPGHAVQSREGTRVRLLRARRSWNRLERLTSRATRWQQSWALTQHLTTLASLGADERR